MKRDQTDLASVAGAVDARVRVLDPPEVRGTSVVLVSPLDVTVCGCKGGCTNVSECLE